MLSGTRRRLLCNPAHGRNIARGVSNQIAEGELEREWLAIHTFMKLRALPSRYHALDQRGRIIMHCRASSKALSPSRIRSQQRLRLANMVASSGSISITCIYDQRAQLRVSVGAVVN